MLNAGDLTESLNQRHDTLLLQGIQMETTPERLGAGFYLIDYFRAPIDDIDDVLNVMAHVIPLATVVKCLELSALATSCTC